MEGDVMKAETHELRVSLSRLEATNALLRSLLVPMPLDQKLASISQGIVDIFEADFCRIWLIRPGDLCTRGCVHSEGEPGPDSCRRRDRCLHLLASSGRYTHTDGRLHSRVPLGSFMIGRIATGAERKHITNDVTNDPYVRDRGWARELGLVSFAGYQLRPPDGEPLGVLALFARRPIDPGEDAMLEGLGSTIAMVAQQSQLEESRRDLEARLHASQKLEAIGGLAGGIAHDFNNMLSVILGYTRMALDEMSEESPMRESLEQVEKAGERAAALTDQLLAFGRRQILKPVPTDLNVLVSDLEKMLRRVIGENIELSERLDGALRPVLADPAQVQQLLMNLVINARDSMPRGGRLTIETANAQVDQECAALHPALKPGPYVRLSVTDTGCGMDDQTLARVFEPFFTTKEVGKGTGLGLATVHGIVGQSGGDIWVQSKRGHGSAFQVYLPAATSAGTNVAAGPAPAPKFTHGTETILIAEDEEVVRRFARKLLEGVGYAVLVARDGLEAQQICEQHPGTIHLVLADLVMPHKGGRDLAETMATLRPATKVLFMSGHSDDTVFDKERLAPGTRLVHKPFTAAALTTAVREVLDGGR